MPQRKRERAACTIVLEYNRLRAIRGCVQFSPATFFFPLTRRSAQTPRTTNDLIFSRSTAAESGWGCSLPTPHASSGGEGHLIQSAAARLDSHIIIATNKKISHDPASFGIRRDHSISSRCDARDDAGWGCRPRSSWHRCGILTIRRNPPALLVVFVRRSAIGRRGVAVVDDVVVDIDRRRRRKRRRRVRCHNAEYRGIGLDGIRRITMRRRRIRLGERRRADIEDETRHIQESGG
jgi:hypothetical protein